MFGTSDVKRALGVDADISTTMVDAITKWSAMYKNQASWLSDYIKSLNLPAAIASEVSRAATIEMQVQFSGSARATFLDGVYQKIEPGFRQMLERGCALGGLVIKPYPRGDSIAVDFVHADQFYPVDFDADGEMTACIFVDQRKMAGDYYTRLELHSVLDSGYEIRNVAFKSYTKDTLGNQVPLAAIDAWAEIVPAITIANINKPLYAYFRYPFSNNEDPDSPLGVSCFSRADDLIEQADGIWSDLLWEFESGRRALYADELAFAKDESGKPILPNKRLYRTLKAAGNIGDSGKLFEEWSPTLREQNILNGLDAVLKRIEFNCGLAYGTLSDPQNVDKTATEILASKQRSASTIADIQKEIRNTLDKLFYAVDTLATLYNLAPRGTYVVDYEFDDSLIVDSQQQFSHDMQMVTMNAMPKWMFLQRNYKLDEATAKKWVSEAGAEMPEPMFPEQ